MLDSISALYTEATLNSATVNKKHKSVKDVATEWTAKWTLIYSMRAKGIAKGKVMSCMTPAGGRGH